MYILLDFEKPPIFGAILFKDKQIITITLDDNKC